MLDSSVKESARGNREKSDFYFTIFQTIRLIETLHHAIRSEDSSKCAFFSHHKRLRMFEEKVSHMNYNVSFRRRTKWSNKNGTKSKLDRISQEIQQTNRRGRREKTKENDNILGQARSNWFMSIKSCACAWACVNAYGNKISADFLSFKILSRCHLCLVSVSPRTYFMLLVAYTSSCLRE